MTALASESAPKKAGTRQPTAARPIYRLSVRPRKWQPRTGLPHSATFPGSPHFPDGGGCPKLRRRRSLRASCCRECVALAGCGAANAAKLAGITQLPFNFFSHAGPNASMASDPANSPPAAAGSLARWVRWWHSQRSAWRRLAGSSGARRIRWWPPKRRPKPRRRRRTTRRSNRTAKRRRSADRADGDSAGRAEVGRAGA